MQLKALKRFSARRPGDVFEVNERMGRLLKNLGRAVEHVEPVPEPVPVPVPVPVPEPEPVRRGPGRPPRAEQLEVKHEEAAPSQDVPRHYHRRDMTAE